MNRNASKRLKKREEVMDTNYEKKKQNEEKKEEIEREKGNEENMGEEVKGE